ncbi:caspase domain-containing protein [Persicitalea sp.]|uniref:caspase family protein n=1 Tax=Persicitalea sp. TaxID=3100273 RepID=UPI0035939529
MKRANKGLTIWIFTNLWVVSFSCRTVEAKTTYAVIVGIADYKISDYRNGDLRYADHDARRFGEFLRSAAGGSVPTRNIVLLTNREATKVSIVKAMRLFQKATAQDRVIFYFSGHGLKGGFLPYDVRDSDLTTVLTHREVKAGFKSSAAITKLCIADACLSGSMTTRETWNAPVSREATSSNVVLMLSSRSTQSSVESRTWRGGVFTYFLLSGLGGKADANRNRTVTIKELYNYLAPRIRRDTPNHQSPLFYGKFSDDLAMSSLR